MPYLLETQKLHHSGGDDGHLVPLVYLAGQAGWIVAEAGRQPWTIEGLLPVKAAVSSVSVGAVQTTFFLFVAIFTLFLVIEMRIMIKAIKQGPKIEEQKGE